MKDELALPRWKYYVGSVIIGSILNIFLLTIILNYFGFSGKSLIALFYISIRGFFYKSIIFFLPFFFLNTDFLVRPKFQKETILLLPFLLFVVWFSLIIVLQIEDLSYEISYGYTDQFPYFFVQTITTFLVCLLIRHRVKKRLGTV
jgi:hypothetical protein